jgi:hypothetical protein
MEILQTPIELRPIVAYATAKDLAKSEGIKEMNRICFW